MLDSRKQSDIEKVEHVLHAAELAGQREVPFATHLDRQHAAPQEDRADRVATEQVWVGPKHSLDLVIAWRLVFGRGCLGEVHRLRGVGCEGWWCSSMVWGLTKVYAIRISATDMRKRATSTMTN